MPSAVDTRFSFQRGLNTDGGPFFPGDGFYRGGLNTIHRDDGSISNRPGIQLLNDASTRTITSASDASYLFMVGAFYGEFTSATGGTVKALVLRWGASVNIWTGELEDIDIASTPNVTITLANVSTEALYYKTAFAQEGNTVIMTNPRSPIYKLVYGNATGSDTFTAHVISLTEINETLFDLPRNEGGLGRGIPGFAMREIPLNSDVTTYVVHEFLASAVPDYQVSVYLVDVNGLSTWVDPAYYLYDESHDTETNLVLTTLTILGETGEKVRVYFGPSTITDVHADLLQEEIVVSSPTKDYGADTSHSPRRVAQFGGRTWFAGINGPLDSTYESTYPALGRKFRKVWISQLFPPTLVREEASVLFCRPVRGPLDIDDNLPLPIDGGTIELDNSRYVYDMAPYGTSMFIATAGGVWGITGPEEYFSLNQIINRRIIDHPISCNDPMVTTEGGIFVFADSEVFQFGAGDKGMQALVENRISSLYGNISPLAKAQSFTRYDSYKRYVQLWYTEDTTLLAQNKYGVSGLADKCLVYDLKNQAWQNPWDFSNGVWGIMDVVVRPTDGFIASDDYRYATTKKVNLAVLARKNGNYTEITLGILEGPKYNADYYSSPYKAAFSSYVEGLNSFGAELGVSTKKQVAKLIVSALRVETDDADDDGFYEYPGSMYLDRRWRFADSSSAGPYYQYSLSADQSTLVNQPKQVYWAHTYGAAPVDGKKPPFEAFQYQTKLRGRGSALALRVGNSFGDTTLTGTIEEQEKPWHLQGYQIIFKSYRG